MSAYQLQSAHLARILAIATALRCGGSLRHPDPHLSFRGMDVGYTDTDPVIFGFLARENAASVNYRHAHQPGEAIATEWQAPRTVRLDTLAEIVAAIKVIDCYTYQSCEHPSWKDCDVKRWCGQLRESLIRALPGFRREYDAAPWGISDQREALAAK